MFQKSHFWSNLRNENLPFFKVSNFRNGQCTKWCMIEVTLFRSVIILKWNHFRTDIFWIELFFEITNFLVTNFQSDQFSMWKNFEVTYFRIFLIILLIMIIFLLSSCLNDSCGDRCDGGVKCGCSSLKSYTQICAEKGVKIHWAEHKHCTGKLQS